MALQIVGNCTRCGDCLPACPNGAVLAGRPTYRIATLLCTECLGYSSRPECVAVCPVNAIVPAALDSPAARGSL